MLQAAAADLTAVIMESVRQMVDAEVKRVLETVVVRPSASTRVEPTVILWSSELAAYMDTDAWQSRTAVLAKVWRRSHEGSFRKAREAWIARGKRPLYVTSKHIMQQEASAATATARPASSAGKVMQDPFVRVQTAEDVERFRRDKTPKDVMRLYRTKGKLLEEETAALFSAEVKQPVGMRNVGVVWEPGTDGNKGVRQEPSVRALGPILSPGPYVLQGEIDACLTQPPFANTPVEFKLRMGGLPSSIPLRDVAQIHSYMAMLGASRGFLVQRAFGSDDVDTSIVAWDETLWTSKIVPAMESVVCDVRRLLRGALTDEDFRHHVLQASENGSAVPPPPPSPEASVSAPTPAEVPSVPIFEPIKLKPTPPPKSSKRKLPVIHISVPEVKYNLRKKRYVKNA